MPVSNKVRDYRNKILESLNGELERSLVLLYAAQTVDERASGSTRHVNGVGFNLDDGRNKYVHNMIRWIVGAATTAHAREVDRSVRNYLVHGRGRMLSGKFYPSFARTVVFKYAEQVMRLDAACKSHLAAESAPAPALPPVEEEAPLFV